MKQEIGLVLKERKRIADETQDEWDYGIEQCWRKETELLSRNMSETLNFIENECDDETFCWLGEVFEDVAEHTQSRDFIAAVKKRAAKVADDEDRRGVETDISYAEDRLFALIGEELQPILEERRRLSESIGQCRKKEVEILSREMADTVYFFENSCDDETFYWLGEVFEEVAELTQSQEFITAIKKRASKIADAEERRIIKTDIDYAENRIKNYQS